MRYHYVKPDVYIPMYGESYICDHPVYNKCTLFKIKDKGLAVIQQRYNSDTKNTYWDEIDPWLSNDLYLHPRFKTFFDERAAKSINDIYPTVTIRQIMWALKMKPIAREQWETYFDRKIV